MLIPQNLLAPHTAQPNILHMFNFFDPACLEYINHLKDTEKWEYAWVSDAEKPKATEVRNTKNIIIEHHNDSDYLYQTLMRKFVEVNNKCFHYSLTSIYDVFLLKYELDNFYKAHLDLGGNATNRKISLIVQLSNEDTYTGCDTIMHLSHEPVSINKTFNTGTFFPSYLLHEATPLLTGTRYALVSWATGEPFR